MFSRKKKFIAFLLLAFVITTAESCSGSKAQKADRKVSERALQGYQNNQPVPVFTYSQLRQNLIELETAQAQTTQTTTFFFNLGVAQPIMSCPSIGFPIPSTAQLTNPEAKYPDKSFTLPQIEATGIYTGSSTGTYVICVNAQGQPYANYWEGHVQSVTGPAVWNNESHQVELTGPPSFKFSKSKDNK